ncbi:MAG: hypothetical protein V5A88_09045 [Candidatus Thermoplasmatota archaeon]
MNPCRLITVISIFTLLLFFIPPSSAVSEDSISVELEEGLSYQINQTSGDSHVFEFVLDVDTEIDRIDLDEEIVGELGHHAFFVEHYNSSYYFLDADAEKVWKVSSNLSVIEYEKDIPNFDFTEIRSMDLYNESIYIQGYQYQGEDSYTIVHRHDLDLNFKANMTFEDDEHIGRIFDEIIIDRDEGTLWGKTYYRIDDGRREHSSNFRPYKIDEENNNLSRTSGFFTRADAFYGDDLLWGSSDYYNSMEYKGSHMTYHDGEFFTGVRSTRNVNQTSKPARFFSFDTSGGYNLEKQWGENHSWWGLEEVGEYGWLRPFLDVTYNEDEESWVLLSENTFKEHKMILKYKGIAESNSTIRIEDLKSTTTYTIQVDGDVYGHSNTDENGTLEFKYAGGWSYHDFKIIEDISYGAGIYDPENPYHRFVYDHRWIILPALILVPIISIIIWRRKNA